MMTRKNHSLLYVEDAVNLDYFTLAQRQQLDTILKDMYNLFYCKDMKVISTERIPIKMWLDNIEEGALEQAKNLANLPFTFKWVAIMPDAHQGYGMPIGGVLATKGVVIPNAVGVDIGCGMGAVKTNLTKISAEDLKKIMGIIREKVPVGFSRQEPNSTEEDMPSISDLHNLFDSVCEKEYKGALNQLGSLGGGNHFIEIQKGDDGHIWYMVHSGSRSLGKKVCDYYDALATTLNEHYYSQVTKDKELAFLTLDTVEAERYLAEMQYAVDYAYANRRVMMREVRNAFKEVLPQVETEDFIAIAHNYAARENHYGENVIVHRKGATLAREGTIGIIPGSQGTNSYIVRGKGNSESFCTCSHGAGRVMSRGRAMKELNLEHEQEILDKQGIVHGIRSTKDLDEAPSAYKDIHKVMDNQKDLVDILVELSPLAVIKG